MKPIKKKGVEVIGVSGDSVEGQRVFKKAHDLNFTLLADDKGAVAKKFGVPLGKGGSIDFDIDGKKVTLTRGVTPKRWTFIIDKDGKIAYKNTKVSWKTDSKTVLEVLDKLAK